MVRIVVVQQSLADRRVERSKPVARFGGEADGDGAVEGDDGARRHFEQTVVQRGDGAPIGIGGRSGDAVHRRDRPRHLKRSLAPMPRGPLEHRECLVDHRAVPARAILLLQRHERAGFVDPRIAACMRQEHEREQAEHLGLGRHQRVEHARQANRLVAQVGPRECRSGRRNIALIEDQVQDRADVIDALGETRRRGNVEGNLRFADLAFAAYDTLCHRRGRHEKRRGDFLRGQAAQRSQR